MPTVHEGKESILNSFSCKCNHSLPCFCPSWWRPEKRSTHPAFSCQRIHPDYGPQRMLIRGKCHRCPREINTHASFSPLFSQDVRFRDTLWKAWYRFCWKVFFSQLSEGGKKKKSSAPSQIGPAFSGQTNGGLSLPTVRLICSCLSGQALAKRNKVSSPRNKISYLYLLHIQYFTH